MERYAQIGVHVFSKLIFEILRSLLVLMLC